MLGQLTLTLPKNRVYMIKEGKKGKRKVWKVVSKKTGEVLGTFYTRAEAIKRLRQIEWFKRNERQKDI
jgi:hypothetical protein